MEFRSEEARNRRVAREGRRGMMKHALVVVVLAVVALVSGRASAALGSACQPPHNPNLAPYAPAFITSPTSGTVVNSTESITLSGYASVYGTNVLNVYARNWAAPYGTQAFITSISVPSTSPVTTSLGTLYEWTATLSLPQSGYAEYWVPRSTRRA